MCPSRYFCGLEAGFVGVSTSRAVFVTGLSTPLIYENVPVTCFFPGLVLGMFTRGPSQCRAAGYSNSAVYSAIVFIRIEVGILLSGCCFCRVIEMI